MKTASVLGNLVCYKDELISQSSEGISSFYLAEPLRKRVEELLAKNPKPTEAQIRDHMDGHLCRCGTYPRVMKAIQLASTRMAGEVR